MRCACNLSNPLWGGIFPLSWHLTFGFSHFSFCGHWLCWLEYVDENMWTQLDDTNFCPTTIQTVFALFIVRVIWFLNEIISFSQSYTTLGKGCIGLVDLFVTPKRRNVRSYFYYTHWLLSDFNISLCLSAWEHILL